MVVSVVIPVFNERNTVLELLRRVVAIPVSKQLVVVDDCSNDGTRQLLQLVAQDPLEALGCSEPAVPTEFTVVFQTTNQGKGAAVRRGFAEARGEVVIVQDADLEYDPREIPRVIQPILDGDADVVFGSRFVGTPRRVLYFWHAVVNRALTTVSNMVTGLNLTDMETCYKAFRREALRSIHLEEDRFGFEPEITAKVARAGLRVYEVPVSYRGRTYEEGKKIGWKDGVRALYAIAKYARARPAPTGGEVVPLEPGAASTGGARAQLKHSA